MATLENNNKIEPTEINQVENETQGVSHEVTIYAEPIAHVGPPAGGFTITNSLVTAWASVVVIIFIAVALRTKLKEVPRGIQNFFEIILEGALSLADQVTGSRKVSEKAFPLVFSIFMFVLINNWLGILPLGGFGLIEVGEHGKAFIPFVRSGTADINTTLALAVMSVVAANIFGIISIGLWKSFNKFVNLKALGGIFTKVRHDPTVLVVAPVTFFVGILELIGEFAKIASLSFRLFGNVFAGEVLLLAMSSILAYILPIPFLFLEIFVGLIQAFIFSILVLVYFSIASQDHEEHGEEHQHTSSHIEENKVAISS